MALALVYDPRYHTWDSWSSLMVEAYSGQQLGIGVPEEKWREWAYGINAIDIFANEAIPTPDYYQNWHDWATALVNAVNQKVE